MPPRPLQPATHYSASRPRSVPGLARIASAVASSSTAGAVPAFAYPDPVALIKAVIVPLDALAEDLQAYVDFLTADPPPLDHAPTPDTDESPDNMSPATQICRPALSVH
jgi:hypothetical protein